MDLRSNEIVEENYYFKSRYIFNKNFLINSIIFVLLLLFRVFSSNFMTPYRRGFFCHDDTLKYPFKDETINTKLLLTIIIPLPTLITFLYGECAIQYQRNKLLNKTMKLSQQFLGFFINFLKQNLYFSIGILMTLNAMDIAKYTLGNLRPHFIAVCQPKILDGTTCQDSINQYRYVEDYYCVGKDYTQSHIHYARLSFPSAHAGLTFFMALYLAIYIEKRFNWQHRRWLKFFIQFFLILMAWFVALTRISDHWHHVIDVVSGSILGILAAIYTAAYIGQFFKPLDL